MRRRVIQVGESSLVVSLPVSWVREYGIRKGDELLVDDNGPQLRMTVEKKVPEKVGTIDISSMYPLTQKIMGVMYKLGYKRMKFIYDKNAAYDYKFKKRKQIDLIKFAVDPFIGVDIVQIAEDRKQSYVIVQERADVEKDEFNHTMDHLFNDVLYQGKQVLEAMRKRDFSIAENVNAVEVLINQTSDFCMKVINTKGLKDRDTERFVYDILNRLETLGDTFHWSYTHFVQKKVKTAPATLALVERTIENVRLYYHLYNKFDLKLLVQLATDNNKCIADCERLMGEAPRDSVDIISDAKSICLGIDGLLDAIISLNISKIAV